MRHGVGRLAWRWTALVVVLLATATAACVSEHPRLIIVADGVVTVQNLTEDDWQGVEVWLNYHYRVTRSVMPKGERFMIPLNTFVAGFGQRFDVRRQVVQTVQVVAKTRAGMPVDLMFGTGPKR